MSETDTMEIEAEVPPFSKIAISIKMTKKKTKLKTKMNNIRVMIS